ncbi:UvrD-helicase domain-containing protein [Legionella fallonii]|uniref:DNA 3'-5' helicase n=1 Tax=Legionella fallonii LLAP-10 TaxID=1212491 RepID=A0A098GAB4_9GAMM|nr:ATP-dependent helicase [Legionella fallonii]CEG59373.1 DNA helicase, UvrD/REP type [Legionella fallonii LLAP-10]
MNIPTLEQKKILDELNSCVVVARPGSGKTFTLSYKIRDILPTLPDYKGVIAISFTNKASTELKHRVLNLGVQIKSSFFGTIDKFCLTEIVIPFLRHKFGLPNVDDVKIIKADESQLLKQLCPEGIVKISWNSIKNLYCSGEVILELSGRLAINLLRKNRILREYMKARYSHVIIDEYQDSGKEQHLIFMELFNLGLIAIAVGDLDQSIYAFAGKSSDYLYELTQRDDFKKYPLTVNHRCHPSIAAYSLKLINSEFVLTNQDKEKRVYSKIVQGHHPNIAQWIEKSIQPLQTKFSDVKLGGIAILCRSNISAKMIKENITKYEVQLREDTPLDSLGSPWAAFFSECLYCLFDSKLNVNEIFDKYLDGEALKDSHKKSLLKLIELKNETNEKNFNKLKGAHNILKETAQLLIPNAEKIDSERALFEVLSSDVYLQSYFPQKDTHIQLMTLHKSKGLEFDVVFHLDLYQWTIPSYEAVKGNTNEMIQSVNLHYVGITRARQACILVASTEKYNTKINAAKEAIISEFLTRADLSSLRKEL